MSPIPTSYIAPEAMMTTTQQDQSAETPQEPQEGVQEAAEEQQVAEVEEAPEEPAQGDSEVPEETEETEDEDAKDDGDHDELPEWGRKQLTKARKDAANYRKRLAEANEKLSTATTPEEFDKVKQELAATQLMLESERIANRHGLPDELRQVLKGDTAEEIEAHAAILAKYTTAQKKPVSIEDLDGGLTPGQESGAYDPRSLAGKHRRF